MFINAILSIFFFGATIVIVLGLLMAMTSEKDLNLIIKDIRVMLMRVGLIEFNQNIFDTWNDIYNIKLFIYNFINHSAYILFKLIY